MPGGTGAQFRGLTFIEEANGDTTFIAKALGDIARARGMTQVAHDAGLSRESLYKALSGEHSPDFATILKGVEALGSSFTQLRALESGLRGSWRGAPPTPMRPLFPPGWCASRVGGTRAHAAA